MKRRTRIKICGISRDGDVDAAVEAGADAIGFVFYPREPRHVDVEGRRRWRGVCRRSSRRSACSSSRRCAGRSVFAAVPSDVLQFHGERARANAPSSAGPTSVARMTAELDLLDFAGRFGRPARSFSMRTPKASAARERSSIGRSFRQLLHDIGHRLVLSGGLHAANVAAGIQELRPWAVDVSSGVESSRGVKDAAGSGASATRCAKPIHGSPHP